MMRRSYRQERGNAHEQMHCDELMQRLQIPHDDARAELAARFATQRNASSGLLYAVGVALLFWVAATQSDSQQKFELESALKVPPIAPDAPSCAPPPRHSARMSVRQ
jgi:ferric-dicitrate binding protein FerR (iron transport regulator)